MRAWRRIWIRLILWGDICIICGASARAPTHITNHPIWRLRATSHTDRGLTCLRFVSYSPCVGFQFWLKVTNKLNSVTLSCEIRRTMRATTPCRAYRTSNGRSRRGLATSSPRQKCGGECACKSAQGHVNLWPHGLDRKNLLSLIAIRRRLVFNMRAG